MHSVTRHALLAAIIALTAPRLLAQQPKQPDPAAWGSDHVGKPVPEFTSGDECLFCHRDVGPGWPTNRHGQTIRAIEGDSASVTELARLLEFKNLAAEVEFVLGSKNNQRFLRRSADHGRLDLLSREKAEWDTTTFGARCAGCHATGIDSAKQAFAAISLDCFVCHGEPSDKHTTQGSVVSLSPHRGDSAAVVTSTCAQCHLRTGESKSTGLPYPNNFVAGDNLFRDFRVDLSEGAVQKLNPADRHVQENVRAVVLLGKEETTCISCHSIHQQSSKKHHLVAESAICSTCHAPGNKKTRIPYDVHSTTCGY
jgi:Cytochrome c3